MNIKIKICGLTNIDNAKLVAKCDIDAIGLVFYHNSPRYVDMETAQKIIDILPPFINRVGLFVNPGKSFVEKVIKNVAIDTIQFHGDETEAFCKQFDMPYIKAIRVNKNTDLKKTSYQTACALLLDSYHPNLYGGSGLSFDWNLIPKNIAKPIILAGGLNVKNVANAVKTLSPFALDVSSGVESTKGVKDIDKITAFINKAKL